MQVVQPTLGVIVVPTVAERIRLRHGALGGEYLPVGIIGITGHGAAAGIQQGHYVALQVHDVIVGAAARLHSVRSAYTVVEEIMRLRGVSGGDSLLQQFAPGVEVAVSSRHLRLKDALFLGLNGSLAGSRFLYRHQRLLWGFNGVIFSNRRLRNLYAWFLFPAPAAEIPF